MHFTVIYSTIGLGREQQGSVVGGGENTVNRLNRNNGLDHKTTSVFEITYEMFNVNVWELINITVAVVKRVVTFDVSSTPYKVYSLRCAE